MVRALALLLSCTFALLYLDVCSCQRDCTGVECPLLDSCVEEVLESGACCSSCLKKGCTCEGYQYYDCVSAGFKDGKVPEGDSYFVDYGSTECSCPAGGGRISCQYFSCPDIPQNCIEVSEPADGCMQCERVGCVHDGQKYEAGHSFHVESCRVCHCPNEGGQLMCYPVPDCDPQKAQRQTLIASTEDNGAGSPATFPYGFDQHGHTDQTPPQHHRLSDGKLPLFKMLPLEKEEPDDYDYDPTDFSESIPQAFVFPTQPLLSSSSSSSSASSSSDKIMYLFGDSDSDRPTQTLAPESSGRRGKQELRERHGVHVHSAAEVKVTDAVLGTVGSTASPHMHATTSVQSASVSFQDKSPLTNSVDSSHARETLGSFSYPLITDTVSPKLTQYPNGRSESTVPPLRGSEMKKHDQNTSDSVTLKDTSTVIVPVKSSEIQTNTEERSDAFLHSLESPAPSDLSQKSMNRRKEMQKPLVLIEGEDETEVEEKEEDGDEIRAFQSVSGHERKNKLHNVKLPHKSSSDMDEATTTEPSAGSLRTAAYQTTPHMHSSSTSVQQPTKEPGSKLKQTRTNLHNTGDDEDVKEEETTNEETSTSQPDVLVTSEGTHAGDLLSGCCAAGQAWATKHRHCDHMPPTDISKQSICSVAQKQCCLMSLKEAQCASGVISARRGLSCDVVAEDSCANESYQVCCSCCALGLQMRWQGQGCNAHQYLGYPCGHVFLTCCEEEEHLSQFPLRRKQKPWPTALPTKVSDSKFPKEAFSTDEGANAVEEQEDVDECQLYQDQLCQHTCTNIWGSYRCGCHRGYVLQSDGHSCTPVSPNEDNGAGEAQPTHTSSTTTTTSTTTVDTFHLNPCADNGPCSHQCAVVAGGARCSCFPGFSLTKDGRTCEDVNECLSNTHSCRLSERCVNTVGSFVCERLLTCPAGYQLRNSVCEDVDECVVRSHSCGMGTVCENTVGSFLCKPKHKCMSGFTQDSHGNCIDINECSSLREACSPGSSCINTVGSFTCQQKVIACNHGYHASPDGTTCVDIDECQVGTHHCGVGHICHNLPGSHRCDCQTGYQYDARRKVCTDINECWHYPGRLCAQTCENTLGSYLCSCTTGFSLASDGKNCEDVNECDKTPCSQECANIYGSYQCYCHQGYYLKDDGHTCEDIDECSQSIGNLCAFQCVNTAGSYQCSCPPRGYMMSSNGRTCRDIDECTSGTHNCSSGRSCYNLQGSFRCLSLDCPPNYRKVADTRCERATCPPTSLECQNSPVRITYYQLSFQTNIVTPAQIFRIGPSPTYAGDQIVISITRGNQEGYFSTRKLNSFTGAVFLQRQVRQPRDFLIDVEMKLLRQGAVTSFLARINVFITSGAK